MTIKELLDEYAGAYRVVDNCEDDGYGCKMCLEDRERMQEIEKELEASIRKEVVEELHNYMESEEGRDLVSEYALSKGIDIN